MLRLPCVSQSPLAAAPTPSTRRAAPPRQWLSPILPYVSVDTAPSSISLRCDALSARDVTCRCAATAAEPSVAGPSPSSANSAEEAELRSLWDSVSKPLLTVGRGGVAGSHARSLAALAAAHTLVKVKVAAGGDAVAAAAALAEQSGCVLLQSKGVVLLFADASADADRLKSAASSNRATTTAKRSRRESNRQDPRLALQPEVVAKLQSLHEGGVLAVRDPDRRALRALASLPSWQALAVLAQLTKAKLRSISNPSAWLTSQCTAALQTAGKQQADA